MSTDEERQANINLEEAIQKSLETSGRIDDQDIITGWCLITETVDTRHEDTTVVILTTSDGVSIVRQLGLLGYAETLVRDHITTPGDDE